MVEKDKSVWPAVLLISALVIIGLLANGIYVANVVKDSTNKPVNIDLTPVVNAVNVNSEKIDALTTTLTTETTSEDSVVTTKDDVTEAKAFELANEFINSKDFKKIIFNTLEDDGSDIEEYKDISKIEIIEADVNCMFNDTCRVVYEKIKVYYEAADDEKATFRNFRIKVNDVDYDDDFEDAEVEEYDQTDTILGNGMGMPGYEFITTEYD